MKNTHKFDKKMQSQQLEKLRVEIEKYFSKISGISCKEFELQLIKISNPDNHSQDFFQFTLSTVNDGMKIKFTKLLNSQANIKSLTQAENELIFLVNIDQFPAFYDSLRNISKLVKAEKA